MPPHIRTPARMMNLSWKGTRCSTSTAISGSSTFEYHRERNTFSEFMRTYQNYFEVHRQARCAVVRYVASEPCSAHS